MIKEAKERDIDTGIIIAPIFPSNWFRPDYLEDLGRIFEKLSDIQPDRVFGETLHAKGKNLELIESVYGKSFFED